MAPESENTAEEELTSEQEESVPTENTITSELPAEEELINNEEDLSEEDKAMYESYLDKVDDSSDLTDEEKAMYHSYLHNIYSSDTAEPVVSSEVLGKQVSEIPLEKSDIAEELISKEDIADKSDNTNIGEDELKNLVDNVTIDEIKDSDLNMLENIIKGNNEEESGEELISIKNIQNNNKEEDSKVKSVENFDSMDELLNKETNMSEEKELETIEKENLDSNVAVEEEFRLGDDDNEPILAETEDEKPSLSDEEDFDGEITQSDLDYAIKLFEAEEASGNVNEYSSKQDILLSENEVNKFKKLFGYFKNIVEKMSPEDLNDFSKTEFYDMYSSLFRKFGD